MKQTHRNSPLLYPRTQIFQGHQGL